MLSTLIFHKEYFKISRQKWLENSLVNMKLSSLYQSWYSSEYDKALKSILSELWLQGIKGPVGREESSPSLAAHDLGRDTFTRCPAWRAEASQAA